MRRAVRRTVSMGRQEGMEEGPVPMSDILYDPSSNPMDDIIGCSAPEKQEAAAEGDAYPLSREEHNPMDDIIGCSSSEKQEAAAEVKSRKRSIEMVVSWACPMAASRKLAEERLLD